jgi:TonB family protein
MSEAWKQWEGQVIDSRFPLRQLLGESSHSAVFATERLDRGGAKAAIKLVAASGAAAEAQLARWRQVARLSHPNILPLYHYGRGRLGELELLFAVMEFADETLAEILPQRALSAGETRQMLENVIGALAYLHQQGLVHGDIQPANILAVGENIKLSSDTLRPIQEASGGTGHTGGATDSRPAASGSVEPAGDIYSLGIMLVQTLTQHSPFDAGTSLGHAAEPLPAPFDDIVLHALHPDPQLRWTAADIAARLKPEAVKAGARSVAASAATAGSAPAASAATMAGTAVAAPKTKQPAAKEVVVQVKSARAAGAAPAAVPLSPVAPLPQNARAGGPSGSLLRYAGVIAAAAVLLFVATRVFRRGTDSPAKTAPATSQSVGVPQPEKAKATPAPKPAATPAPESSKEAPRTEPNSAPQQTASKAAAASVPETSGKQPVLKATGATPEVVPTTEASPAALRSEVRSRPAASSNPEVLQQVLPEISQKALSTIHGTVRLTVRVQVDGAGKVSDAEMDSPSGSTFFNDLAMKAARKWQFQPVDAPPDANRSYLLRFEFTQAGATASVTPAR